MKALWIIGNGFDLNIGLDTGYDDFRDRAYMKDEEAEPRRKRLVEAVKSIPSREELVCWSDFEALLGASSKFYGEGEMGLFTDTFEEIQDLFVRYVASENERFDSADITEGDCEEACLSITRFWDRLTDVEKQRLLPLTSVNEVIRHSFVSLNYTSCFDDYLECAQIQKAPFDRRSANGVVQKDVLGKVFHVHGSLEAGDGIVFGVCDAAQIANDSFAADEGFLELWTKPGKNALYGNLKAAEMRKVIGEARLFCLFGVSLGETDSYIWKEIGKVLAQNSGAQAVVFAYDLPSVTERKPSEYQKAREGYMSRFVSACGLSAEKAREVRNRVSIVSSKLVFRLTPPLRENEKYPELQDR